MIFFDALSMKFRNVKLRDRQPGCAVCGPDCPNPIRDVSSFDYADFCQTNCNKYALIKLPKANTVPAKEFYSQIENDSAETSTSIVIDVRPQV